MTERMTLGDIFDIPERVHQGDLVLKLTEGVAHAEATLAQYVVTDQLADAFDRSLALVQSALDAGRSKAAFLHGSFGSGKSHFMAVLSLLLDGNTGARKIPRLAPVVARHAPWLQRSRVLVLPYHMIGASSLEAAILGGYAEWARRTHPERPAPAFFTAERLLEDARHLRGQMGDERFFARLGQGGGADEGWGALGGGWDGERFEAAAAAPQGSQDKRELVGALIAAFFPNMAAELARDDAALMPLDQGLAELSRHAQELGYDAVVLFLDELILWLASHAADQPFLNREAQKVAQLVEAQHLERPVPVVSFLARQRDLRELVGDNLPGAQQLGFADVLDWWKQRFELISLEDRNLPVIANERLLRPRNEEAARALAAAFEQASRVRQGVLDILLTRDGDVDMFRLVYPFSPALMQTLVAVSSLLQRERTALKLMQQLLVDRRDRFELGQIIPVGDLYDVVSEGDEPFSQVIRAQFDNAKRLYRHKLRPLLEGRHGVSEEDVRRARVPPEKASAFTNEARLAKTLILAALAPEVEALKALTPQRLAALNHGSVRSPVPGAEGSAVLSILRNWATQVGEVKFSDDGPNPTVSLQLSGVETESIIQNARELDNMGNRVRLVRDLLFADLGLTDEQAAMLQEDDYRFLWRGSRRSCRVLFANVRTLELGTFESGDEWRLIIDYPFDEPNHSPADDRTRVFEYRESRPSTNTLVWLPSFLNARAENDLGRLVILERLLTGDNLERHGGSLSVQEREQARLLLDNQRNQLRQQLREQLLSAYGLSTARRDDLDQAHALDQHFESLAQGFDPRPPVGGRFRDCVDRLLDQALRFQYPGHPDLGREEARPPALKRVRENASRAAADPARRTLVDRAQREEMKRIAEPLRLGEMGETHFVLGDYWREHFERLWRNAGSPGPLTAGRLRAWTDVPEPRGLAREVQDLVILVFAEQTNRVFLRYGGPEDPALGHLDDDLELQEADLPDADAWETARDRMASLFGRADIPAVRNASNAGRLQRAIEEELARHHTATARYARALQARLESWGLESSDRLRTAEAADALLRAMAEAEGSARITALNEAELVTSASAVSTAMSGADRLARALEDADWRLFDTTRGLPEAFRPRANACLDAVRQALENDEHVVGLRQRLEQAQDEAHGLIREALEAPKPVSGETGTPGDSSKPGPSGGTGPTAKTVQRKGLTPDEVRAEVNQVLAETQDGDVSIDLTLVVHGGAESE